MLRDLFEIGFSYIQYVLLLVAISPELFPSYYNWPVLFLKYINLDMSELLSESNRGDNFLAVKIPSEVPLDVRLQFVLVSVGIPLLLAVISLFSLSSKTFFFWFLFFLLGVMFLVVAVLSFAIEDPVLNKQFSSSDRNFALYVGIAVIVFATAIAMTYRSIVKSREKTQADKAERARKKRKQKRKEQGLEVSSSEDGEGVDGGSSDIDDTSSEASSFALGEGGGSPSGGDKDPLSPDSPSSSKKKKKKQQSDDAPQMKSVMSMVVQSNGEGDDSPKKNNNGETNGEEDDDDVDAEADTGKSMDDIMRREAEQFHVWPAFERFLYSAVCIFFGLLLLEAFRLEFIYSRTSDAFMTGLGSALFILGVVLFFWFVLGLTKKGRILMFKLGVFARDNFVSALLLLVTVLYVPAVKNIVMIFNCEEYTCPAYSRPPDPYSVVYAPLNGSEQCETCDFSFVNQSCPLDLQADLCFNNTFSGDRLSRNPRIDCENLRKYFWPASGIMFVSFVISMPLLNFILTTKSTAILEEEFPLDSRQIEGYTDEELFIEKVHLSDNVAKFIYDPFQRRFKHWRSLFLFQKLAIVVCSVFEFPANAISSEGLGVMLSLIVHTFAIVYVVVTSPFNRKVENFFMVITQLELILAASCGMAATQGTAPPDEVFVMVAVFAFLLPAGSLAIGAVLTFRDNIKKSREREERINRAQRQAAEGDENNLDGFDEGIEGTSLSGDHNHPDSPVGGVSPGAGPALMHGHIGASPMLPAAASSNPVVSPQSNALSPGHQSKLDVPSVLDTPLSQGPTSAAMWFGPSKLSLLSPMHRYGHMNLTRRRTKGAKTVHSGQQATLTAQLLRSGAMHDRTSPTTSSPTQQKNEKATRNFNFLSVDSKNANNGQAHSSDFTFGEAPRREFQFIKKIGKERWQRIKDSLLAKVRADRQKREEEEEERTLQKGGAVAASFFSKGGQQNSNVKVGAGKYKNKKAMNQWDQLLKDLIRKGKEERAKREAEAAGEEAPDSAAASPAVAAPELQGPSTKRQQLALRAELKKLYDMHLQKLRSQQQAVDFKINKNTINAMQMFYVCVGVMAFVALGFCILGILSNKPPDNYILSSVNSASRVDAMLYEDQLAGYEDWPTFTASCCCLPFVHDEDADASMGNPTSGLILWPHYAMQTEKWLCKNGKIKERIRVYQYYNSTTNDPDAERSGLKMRDLCGMTFKNPLCVIGKNDTSGLSIVPDACIEPGMHEEEMALW